METEKHDALTPKQAAQYLGVSNSALRLWRAEGRGPPWYRAGAKLVRYRVGDLNAWIEARLHAPEASAA